MTSTIDLEKSAVLSHYSRERALEGIFFRAFPSYFFYLCSDPARLSGLGSSALIPAYQNNHQNQYHQPVQQHINGKNKERELF